MCGQDNWIVANCTTPSNYFHIPRRQIHRSFRKPLVLMTPKSLLRHKLAISASEDFTTGSSFHRVLWDDAQKGNSDTKLVADDKIKRRDAPARFTMTSSRSAMPEALTTLPDAG